MLNNESRLFRKAPCGYLVTDAQANLLQVNDLLCEWLGYSRAELEGKKHFRDLVTVGGKIYFETTHTPLIRLRDTVKELSYYLVAKDKKRIPVLVNTSRYYPADEEELKTKEDYLLQFIIFPFFDRKKYEKEILAAKKAAEKAAAAKSLFLNTVTHELRTPIHSILHAGKLLAGGHLTEDQRELTDILQFSAESLLDLVNSVLDLSKMEANNMVLQEKPFDLRKLTRQLMRSFRIQADTKDLKLKLHLPENMPPEFLGDSGKIKQVLVNLIGNAVKFTKQGEVTLTVKYTSDKNLLHFSIADTGIGIDPLLLEKIFIPFSQATNDIHTDFGGTGLGLSICKRILEAYQSQLHVESEKGKGAVFSFTLELEAATPSTSDVSAPVAVQSPLTHLKVLVADDVHSNLVIIGRYFKQKQLPYATATSGKQALDLIFSDDYDLVFLDISMPDMSGYEVARKVRARSEEKYRTLPLVALTAFDNAGLQQEAKENGMTDVLQKPFAEKDLFDTIRRYTKEADFQIEKSPVSLETSDAARAVDFAFLYEIFDNDTEEINQYLRAVENDLQRIREDFIGAEKNLDLTAYRAAAHKTEGVMRFLKMEKLKNILTTGEEHLTNRNKKEFADTARQREIFMSKAAESVRSEIEKSSLNL